MDSIHSVDEPTSSSGDVIWEPDKSGSISSARCTSLSLRRAARAASQILEHYLQPVGLHASQFGILNTLSRFGSITMTGLSDEMSLDRTTVTRNLQIMEREDLVHIVAGHDRRVREIALTKHGKDILEQAIPLWRSAEAALANQIGSVQREALLGIVDAVSSLARSTE